MKLLIAHRGLYNGPDPWLENKPEQITKALTLGFDAEVDVWWHYETGFMLGHDSPTHRVSLQWLSQPGLWIHAKNLDALDKLLGLHVFWHENDQYTLTSNGYIWTYPGVTTSSTNGIMVMPEYKNIPFAELGNMDCYGICSDHAAELRHLQK